METHSAYWQAVAADKSARRQVARALLSRRKQPLWAQPGAPGHVVEFVKSGHPVCGILLWRGRRTCGVLDINGKEDSVAPARIFDTSSTYVDTHRTRHQVVDDLEAVHRERERMKGEIDAFELWDVVQEEGREWTLDELAALSFPDGPGPHGKAALFRALEECPAFQRRGRAFMPLPARRVAKYRTARERAEESEAWLERAAAWFRALADGEDVPRPEGIERAVDLLASHVLFGADHPRVREARTLAKLAHFHTRHAVFDALVRIGHWRKDEDLDLLRHDVPTAFSVEEEEEAAAAACSGPCPEAAWMWQQRVFRFGDPRLPAERAFSVCPRLSGFVVGVHFAAPALLLAPEGLIAKAAAERAAALRLPDQVIPMLPEAVLRACSLDEREGRPTLTLRVQFSQQLEVEEYAFEVCRARLDTSADGASVAEALPGDWGLQALLDVARRLRRARIARGAVVIPEPSVAVGVEDGMVTLVRESPDAPGRLIEEELSILANTLAGRLCVENHVPAIYRTEDRCREVLVDPARPDPVACFLQKRLMPRAGLQTDPGPHHGLGVPAYVPIDRSCTRYTDLLMQQQLVGWLSGGAPARSSDDLAQELLYTASARDTVRTVERSSKRYWLLRYLEAQFPGEQEATVLETFGNGYLVELSETLLRAFCPARSSSSLQPGTRVRVRLAKASAREDVVCAALV